MPSLPTPSLSQLKGSDHAKICYILKVCVNINHARASFLMTKPIKHVEAKLFSNYLYDSLPLIGELAEELWGFVFNWKEEYLLTSIGHKLTAVCISPNKHFYRDKKTGAPNFGVEKMSVKNLIHKIFSERSNIQFYYMQGKSVVKNFPELQRDIVLPQFLRNQKTKSLLLWLGGAGCITDLHFDVTNGILIPIVGAKKVRLFSPDQTKYLNMFSVFSKARTQSGLNFLDKDHPTFLRLKKASHIDLIIKPGQFLYIPPGWWHQVENLDPAISVNVWWPAWFSQCMVPQWKTMLLLYFNMHINILSRLYSKGLI